MPPEHTFLLTTIPARRWGRLEDMMGAVLYLCSAASDYVNGAILTQEDGRGLGLGALPREDEVFVRELLQRAGTLIAPRQAARVRGPDQDPVFPRGEAVTVVKDRLETIVSSAFVSLKMNSGRSVDRARSNPSVRR